MFCHNNVFFISNYDIINVKSAYLLLGIKIDLWESEFKIENN